MIKRTRLIAAAFISLICSIHVCAAQDNPWLLWSFKTEHVSRTETTLLATASLAPGWHIYSQYLGDDGPPPTHITFNEDDSYQPVGKTKESGNKARIYSEIFETYLVWYSGTVTFSQQFNVFEPVTTITGTIAYMTCNDDTCVPAKKEFTVNVNLLKQR